MTATATYTPPIPRSGARKRASVFTLGCRLNQSETAVLEEKLRAAGYDLVPFGEPADLGIVNTCTVTCVADAKSRQVVRQFIRANPDGYTAVIGCYAQMGYKTLSQIEGVDLIVGNQEKLNLLDYVAVGKTGEALVVRDRIERDDFTIEVTGGAPQTRRANLKIQDGCDFMCSFCIIPFARGRARSRALDNLLEEAHSLAQGGAKELVLTGVNIGTYAYDGHDIVSVVDRLDAVPGVARIRISSIEPTTIPEALFERMGDPGHALVPYLHIPLQSGSDRVLALMKRKYTRQEFVAFIREAAARVPGVCIGTDVLVGSPGETEADFEATCAVLTEEPVAYAHVFTYSERAGTAAARYPEKVAPQEQNRRSARVRQISARKRAAFYEARLGTVANVLFEHEQDGYWEGYTADFVRVAAESAEDLGNRLRSVRLIERCSDVVLGALHDGSSDPGA